MSFKENDKKHMINLDNYEEYFLLYVDGELNEQDMKEVDAFINNHPALKAEMDILLSTRLTAEDVTIEKDELYSFSMDKLMNEEQLLSYIDGELSIDEKRKLEEKINSIPAFKLQYEILLKTKLDPSEIISYPNKEELYKRTRRVVPFSPRLRAAAVFILVAAGFIIYEKRNGIDSGTKPAIATTNIPSTKKAKQEIIVPAENNKRITVPENVVKGDEHIAVLPDHSSNKKETKENTITNRSKTNEKELAVNNDIPNKRDVPVNNPAKDKIEVTTSSPLIAYVPTTQTINNSPVTSALTQRTTSSSVSSSNSNPDPVTTVAARSDSKRSFKSLLRKAARVIEKKTGIDPANENDELLIGAVAVKLN